MEKKLRALKEQGILTDAAFFAVLGILSELKADFIQMIDEWEQGIDPTDKTLYSLALRRALDLVTGVDSVDNSEEENNE